MTLYKSYIAGYRLIKYNISSILEPQAQMNKNNIPNDLNTNNKFDIFILNFKNILSKV